MTGAGSAVDQGGTERMAASVARQTLGGCDWGHCGGAVVATRFYPGLGELPVCFAHENREHRPGCECNEFGCPPGIDSHGCRCKAKKAG